MKDLLIDIEALGLRPGAAIVQLAAVLFDSATGETGDEINLYIQPEKQDPWHADLDTLAWHQNQGTFPHPPEVAEFIALPAGDAIDCFLSFLSDLSDAGHEIQTVWSWGATYDFPLLDPYWERYATGGEAPWPYYVPRCARTVWQVAFPGVKHAKRPHHALDDCKAAISDLCMALSHLKGNAAAAPVDLPTLGSILARLGIVDPRALADPEGYDGHETAIAVARLHRELTTYAGS